MRKKARTQVLSLLLALIMVLGLLPGTAWAAGGTLKGSGTAGDPYLIADAADLAAFRDMVNGEDSSKRCAKLTADIQLTGDWTPFSSQSGYPTTAYEGTFDGGGHTISGLRIDASTANQGLFSAINGATIRNLKVEGNVTSSKSYVGGIVGKVQQGTIENCSFSGNVRTTLSSGCAGGIAGAAQNLTRITGCANYGTITGYAGGIIGYGKAAIENCYNKGTINGTTRAGGIIGQFNGSASTNTIKNSYNIGDISLSATNYAYMGSISGFNGTLTNCYWTTPVEGTGNNTGTLSHCEQITSTNGLADKLGEAFTTDANGNVILAWQTGGAVEPPKPGISISSSEGSTLWVAAGGSQKTRTTLSVICKSMDDETPSVTWDYFPKTGVGDISRSTSDENALIVDASGKKGGILTVTAAAAYQGKEYTAEYTITVIPHFATVSIENTDTAHPGNIAVGQTVRAVINTTGGVFKQEDFPGLKLTYQWYRRPGGGASAAISGATGETCTIPDSFNEWDKIGIEVKCGRTIIHSREDQQEPVRTADHGKLYPVAYDGALIDLPAEIKTDGSLTLPSSVEKDGVIAGIEWSSSNETVIAPDGTVSRPSGGTAEVKLTGKFTYNKAYFNRFFTVKVWSDSAIQEEADNRNKVLEAAAGTLSAGTLYPVFGTDKNLVAMAKAALSDYKDVSVSIRSVEEVYGGAGIAPNGDITYFYADPDTIPTVRFGSYRVTFTLSKDGQSLEQEVPVIIYWDKDRVEAVMKQDILARVSGPAGEVTGELSLPKVVDNKRWTLVSWESSAPEVISVSSENQSTADTLFDPYTAIVRRGTKEREVTLTAKFTFQLTNDVIGNEEPVVLYKTFRVTVPAMDVSQTETIRRGLQAKLDAGFAKKGLTDAVTGNELKPDADVYTASNDIQLPITRDFGVDGKYYPVTITTSDDAVLKAPDVNNAARVAVYRPGADQEDAEGTITVTLHDRGTSVTASRTFRVKVPALTQEEIDTELALMERVKASYFEGIKGENDTKDNVRTDLSPFFEVYERGGELVWVRKDSDRTGRGIVPVPIEGWEDLELWRLFKSSNPKVISHENLLVTRQTEAKAVTITSRLSSETLGRYGELYVNDPVTYAQYAGLEWLYNQEVSTDTSTRPEGRRMARTAAQSQTDTIVVRGTKNPDSADPVTEPVNNVTFSLTGLDGAVWIAPTSLAGLDESSTVYDVFVKLLGRDYIATRVKGTYIKAISGPDGSLAEKDHGENSGWMYRVNGRIPDVYMGACPLRSGDVIQVFYTRDAKKDDPDWNWPAGGNSGSVSGSPSSGTAEQTNAVSVEKSGSADTYTVTLPEDSTGPRLVTIPDVKAGQLVVIVHSDGREEVIKKSVLENDRAKFLLDQSATVRVIDHARTFGDVDNSAWYSSAVDFVSGRELFSGIGRDAFAPDLALSRGMLAAVLYRLEEPDAQNAEALFSDVTGGSWYGQGVAWAAETGIVSGYGDGRFGPDDSITREQLAAMLFRYAQLLNMSTGGRDSLTGFSDASSVSPWAQDAVAWAVDSGIISGLPDGTLAPTGTATRAEAAAMLQRFVSVLLR